MDSSRPVSAQNLLEKYDKLDKARAASRKKGKRSKNKPESSSELAETIMNEKQTKKAQARENITYLREQNIRLETMQKELQQQMVVNFSDQQKHIDYFQEELKTVDTDIARLMGQNSSIEKASKKLQIEQNQKMEDARTQNAKKIQEICNAIDDLRNKCNALEKFTVAQALLQQELANYKKAIVEEAQSHEKQLEELLKKREQEKELLKKKMKSAIENTKLSVLQQIEDSLHPTTKRTIQRTLKMENELMMQQDQVNQLSQQNSALSDELATLTLRDKEQETQIQQIATQTNFLNKLRKKLKDKLVKLQEGVSKEALQVQDKDRSFRMRERQVEISTKSLVERLRVSANELKNQLQEAQEQYSLLQLELDFSKKRLKCIVEAREPRIQVLHRTIQSLQKEYQKTFKKIQSISEAAVDQRLDMVTSILHALISSEKNKDLNPPLKLNWLQTSLKVRSTQTDPVEVHPGDKKPPIIEPNLPNLLELEEEEI